MSSDFIADSTFVQKGVRSLGSAGSVSSAANYLNYARSCFRAGAGKNLVHVESVTKLAPLVPLPAYAAGYYARISSSALSTAIDFISLALKPLGPRAASRTECHRPTAASSSYGSTKLGFVMMACIWTDEVPCRRSQKCGNESLLTLPRTSSPVGPETLPAIGSNCSLATVSHCIVYATQLITAVNADVPAQPKLAPGKNTPVEGIGNELGKLNWSFQALQI